MASPCKLRNSSLNLLDKQAALSWWQRPVSEALIPEGSGSGGLKISLTLYLAYFPGHCRFSGWKDAYSFSQVYIPHLQWASFLGWTMVITMAGVVARHTTKSDDNTCIFVVSRMIFWISSFCSFRGNHSVFFLEVRKFPFSPFSPSIFLLLMLSCSILKKVPYSFSL